MTGSGSPCGACKFLRRKCVRGCIFAPYFCHEQGATHFAAIHKVFGASNVSKLLAHLPVSDRCRAALTISYEAQARVQDPVYGCVSHIFALQQQVINLQAQLALVKEQTAKSFSSTGFAINAVNPSDQKFINGRSVPSHAQLHDVQSWLQSENSNMMPQSLNISASNMMPCPEIKNIPNSFVSRDENFIIPEVLNDEIYSCFGEGSNSMCSFDMQTSNMSWGFDQDTDHR